MREGVNAESQSNNRAVLISQACQANEKKAVRIHVHADKKVVFSKRKLNISPRDQNMLPLYLTIGTQQNNLEIEAKSKTCKINTN